MSHRQARSTALLYLFALCLPLAAGCTTQSYYREDGVKVTVEKFAGIPYLEKEEKTTVVPAGSEYLSSE